MLFYTNCTCGLAKTNLVYLNGAKISSIGGRGSDVLDRLDSKASSTPSSSQDDTLFNVAVVLQHFNLKYNLHSTLKCRKTF